MCEHGDKEDNLVNADEHVLEPQFICMTCKTVIGPIWDDYDNQCKCGPYEFEVWRVGSIPTREDEQDQGSDLQALKSWACGRLEAETANRPDCNIHKRTLTETWNQVIRELESRIAANPVTKGKRGMI